MSENLNETISFDEAVSQMIEEPEQATQDADDVTEEVETEEVDAEESETHEGETDETEEADAETDEIEEEDNDDAEEEDGDDDPTFEIETVNGKQEVKLSELTKGFMLNADYTQKTMAVAEERKKVEALQGEISQAKQQLTQALEYWAVPVDQEPNWAELAEEYTPQQVFAAQQRWKERQDKAQQAREHHQALVAHEQEQVRAKETEKLLEAFPEWRDPAKFRSGAEAMVKAGGNYGFEPQEMAELVDHRMFKVLADAMKYRELQAAKPKVTKKVSQAPRKLKSGAKPDKSEAAKVARQKQSERLKKTGSVDDAIDLLMM